jgi:nucleoside-diphosphate-sugar epimerase
MRGYPQPMQEESLLSGPLEPTNRPYAIAKIAGIELCRPYHRCTALWIDGVLIRRRFAGMAQVPFCCSSPVPCQFGDGLAPARSLECPLQ